MRWASQKEVEDGPGKAPHRSARFYAVVAIAAALATVGLKAAAYLLTGSVGLLSDAAESSANLVAAVGAFWALSAAARPPDEEHAYGHTKAEFFSSALEGALVLAAAAFIAATAVGRLFDMPRDPSNEFLLWRVLNLKLWVREHQMRPASLPAR